MDINKFLHSQSMKSHTLAEILQGLQDGMEIWLFDSGISGKNDTLLYPAGTSVDEVRSDLEDLFFSQKGNNAPADLWYRDWPTGWSLDGPIDAEAAAKRWPQE